MSKQSTIVRSLEILSIIGFGLAYWKYDLRVATMVLMALMTLFVLFVIIKGERLSKLQIITWLAVVILGSATVALRDDRFIMWKPTIVNSLVGLVFLVTNIIGKHTLLERLLKNVIIVPAKKLKKLNITTGIYFLCLGGLNLYIANNYSQTVWVNFKIFGVFLINLVFLMYALWYLRSYLKDFFERRH